MPVASLPSTLHFPLSESQLEDVNAHLSTLSPEQVLSWALTHLPNLYQSTAFGLTGLAATDMLSKLTHSPPPLIFIDTLYHFQETLDLKDEVQRRYRSKLYVYRPKGQGAVGQLETAEQFEAEYGKLLWETNDLFYDYLVKVEPAQRAYKELGVKSIITGRRASQGGARATLKPLEVDSTGLLKLNPFYAWTFAQVKEYIEKHNVPRNALLSQGYKSIGDWHSTAKSGEGDAGERAGRWQGKSKSECGLHVNYHDLKQSIEHNLTPTKSEGESNPQPLSTTGRFWRVLNSFWRISGFFFAR